MDTTAPITGVSLHSNLHCDILLIEGQAYISALWVEVGVVPPNTQIEVLNLSFFGSEVE